MTPLIFALLGTALILRFNRGGRGLGIFLALVGLMLYYLITLLGEQLARTGQISVFTASLFPIAMSLMVIAWLFLSNRFLLGRAIGNVYHRFKANSNAGSEEIKRKKLRFGLTTAILDFDIIRNLLKYFSLTVIFLTAIYMIFTAFELWKFAGEISGGFFLLMKYLFFLLPFIYLQLAPSALMIATLATFVIKSRQNEIVSWTAAGQSVYRLLLPCFSLMILLGIVNWGIQETIAPKTNKIQDQLRAQIRSRGIVANREGKYWVTNDKRIYSFELAETKTDFNQKVKNLSVYEFSADETKLQSIYRAPEAVWEKNVIKFSAAERQQWSDGAVEVRQISNGELIEASNPFNNLNEKPSHLDRRETEEQIKTSESEIERRNLEVALEKNTRRFFCRSSSRFSPRRSLYL